MDSTWTESEQRGSQAETAEWLSLQVGLGSQEVEFFFFFAEWLSMVEWEFDASTKNGLNVLQLPGAKSSGSRRRRKR